LNKILKDKLP